MTTQNTIRLIIADDHPMVREGVCAMLTAPDIEVVGEASTGRAAIGLVQKLDPSVVLLDLRMPDLNGLEACRLLHSDKPELPILILSMYESSQYMAAARSAGAAGYISKGATRENLLSAVRTVAQGLLLWEPDLAPFVAGRTGPEATRLSPRLEDETTPALSPREREILALLTQGLNNREIARAYDISMSTVKTHVAHLLHKLAVADRVQAAVWAVMHGFEDPTRWR